MKFWKKSVDPIQESQTKYGFSVPVIPDTFDTGRTRVCLVKALLIFCTSLGTIGSVVSAFELPVNLGLILCLLAVMSLTLSFLHYNHLIFNLFYPMLFFLFAFSIIQNRIYVNSGYQAIVNLIKEAYRDYYGLSYIRQGSETISDRYLTITCSLIYLGFFLIVLLNIAISTYMSILWTILMTFPFLQFGLYIGKIPSLIYVLLLLFSYTAVLFLKWSGHYTLSENSKKDKPFFQKKAVSTYKGHGKTMAQTLALALVLSLCFSILTYPVMQSNFLASGTTSQFKAATDSTIRRLVQNGMFGFMNRYQASGGISNGRLGGVSSVQSDYQTDLEVSFVPTSADTIYLKAYTGGTYTSTQWLAPDYSEASVADAFGAADYIAYHDYTAFLEANRMELFAKLNPHRSQYGKMVIRNLDASGDHLYLPYYSTPDGSDFSYRVDHSIATGSSHQTYTLYYYPYTQDFSKIIAANYDQLRDYETTTDTQRRYIQYYDMLCRLNYNDIPPETLPALHNAMEEIGESDTVSEQLALIRDYFENNFHYTLSPGTTPLEQDFATYFLEEQKEGYCAHFATAGTLLCRAYGIPARYVEGYVIQLNNMVNAEVESDEDVSKWLTGSSDFEKTNVITVDVPDANAHAWTEVYVEGFGWIPYDFTPPSTEIDSEVDESMLQSLFSGLFSTSQSQQNRSGDNAAAANRFSSLFNDNLFLFAPIAILLATLLLFFVVHRIALWVISCYRRKKAYKNGQYDLVLAYYYNTLTAKLIRSGQTVPDSPLPRHLFALLATRFDTLAEQTQRAFVVFHEGLYSKESITKEKADFFIHYTKEICRKLSKKRS